MRKLLVPTTILVFVWAAVFSLPILAAGQVPIAVTVTPKLISVSVSPTSVSYGTLGLGANASSGTITTTNNGNVAEDFDIKADVATTTGGSWSLVSGSGSPGANEFKHSFNLGPSYDDPFTVMTTGYGDLVNDVAALGTQDFKLQIKMPSSTSVYGQYTTSVEILATEH